MIVTLMMKQFVLLLLGMFAKIGVKVNLDAKTKSQHFSEVKEGDANGMTSDMYMLGWGVPTFDSHYVYSYLV